MTEKISGVLKEISKECSDPQLRWELLKYEIRKFTIAFSKAKAKKSRATLELLEAKIKDIENIPNWERIEKLTKEHIKAKLELDKYYDYITEGLILRSKVNWYEYGEKSNKYFLTLERRKKNKTHIRKIKLDDKSEITNPKDILKNIEAFYDNLYASKNKTSEADCTAFLSHANIEKLNETDRLKCEGYVTVSECYDALQQMGNMKSPGNDGLSKEFYITFWDSLSK